MPFENPFDILLAILIAFYSLTLLGLTVGILRRRDSPTRDKPFVSVIVAARNEESHVDGVLDSLVRQQYPAFEIVIVDDRSSDRTPEIIEEYRHRYPSIRRIDITTPSIQMPSKKHALAQGIAVSQGEILLFTDADCLPPPGWIATLVEAFAPDVGLVAGYSPYILREHAPLARRWGLASFLHMFIEYEEFKGAAWSAGSIGVHLGWLCTGRSLAYRRSVYDQVGGFNAIKHSVSGDDDLFLQLVRRTTRWRIRYVTSPKSHVPTYPSRTFGEFVRQRTRHFSAGRFFPLTMKLFFMAFHLSNLVLLLSFIWAIAWGSTISAFLPYIAKCFFDTVLFFAMAWKLKEMRFAPLFLPMEVVVTLYNTCIGPLGFVKTFSWKSEGGS